MTQYLEHNFIHLRATSYVCSVCSIKVRGYFDEPIIFSQIYLDIYIAGKPLILTCKEQMIKNLLE